MLVYKKKSAIISERDLPNEDHASMPDNLGPAPDNKYQKAVLSLTQTIFYQPRITLSKAREEQKTDDKRSSLLNNLNSMFQCLRLTITNPISSVTHPHKP